MNKISSMVSEKFNKGYKNLSLHGDLIPCSEKLPEVSGYYFAITKYGGIQLLHFSSKFLEWNATDDCAEYAFCEEEIYAWIDDDSILINVDNELDVDNETNNNDNVNNTNWTPGMIAAKLLLAYYYGRKNTSSTQVNEIISMDADELTQALVDNVI